MKLTKTNKHNNLGIILGLLSVFPVFGQQKLEERFNVKKEVVVNLNTSHTNIVFETWNKDIVAVEAYINGEGLSDDQIANVLDGWQVDATGNSSEINIAASNSKHRRANSNALSINMQDGLRELQVLGPMLAGMLEPLLQNIAQNPIPEDLSKNIGALQFDYAEYQKDGEKYMKKWEVNMEDKFGKDFEVAMEKWGNKMEKDSEKWSKNVEVQMEAWGAQFEKDMERWGAQFEQQMEQWVSQNVSTGQTRGNNGKYIYEVADTPAKVSKILKVKIPKKAQLKLNIRHGEVTLADQSNNLNASLSHTKLAANVIDGSDTRINASYSPILVKQWNDGVLVIDYVKNCRIENAKDIRLKTNSSNVYIQNLDANGVITGNFGRITIANMNTDFSTLNLNLQNSDLKVKLPQSAFNFTYLGSRSLIQLPKTMEIKTMRNFGNESMTGFFKSRNTDRAITINAKYSELELQ